MSNKAYNQAHDHINNLIKEGSERLNGAQVNFVIEHVRQALASKEEFKARFGAVALNALRGKTNMREEDEALLQKLASIKAIEQLAGEFSQRVFKASITIGEKGPTESNEKQKPHPSAPTLMAHMKAAVESQKTVKSKSYEGAVHYANEALRYHPKHPHILFSAGVCFMLEASVTQNSLADLPIRVHYLQDAVTAFKDCMEVCKGSESLKTLLLNTAKKNQEAVQALENAQQLLDKLEYDANKADLQAERRKKDKPK